MRGRNSSTLLIGLAAAIPFFIVLLFLTLLILSKDNGAVADGSAPADTCSVQQPDAASDADQIPSSYLKLYRSAGDRYGIPWNVIAGIGKVESDHGQSKLKGVHSGENYAGAGGPMQFIKSTWELYGVDGNGDRRKSRYDPEDAIPAAARYLKASGAPGDIRKAIFAYNHLNSYVDLVLSWAQKYSTSVDPSKVEGDGDCVPGEDPAGDAEAPPAGGSHRRSPRVGVAGCQQVTQAMINELDSVLGPYPTVGCARPGDPQDHGSGHAADFMVSSGGRLPSPNGASLGNQTAEYALAHYKRLRIKYVIWQQRIWNPSICKCWRQMDDRGSVTQNHYDHVHISVLG